MEIRTNSNKKAYIFALSIVLLIILSAYVGRIANFAALALFFVALFSLQKIDMYILLFAIFPFANIFKLSPASMSLATVCEFLFFAFIFWDFLKNRVPAKRSFLFSIFLFLIYLVIGVFSAFSITILIKLLIRPFLIYYIFNSNYSYEKKQAVTCGVAVVLAVSMVSMMFLSLNSAFLDRIIDFLRVVQIQDGLEQLTRNGGLFGDPNYCSLAILMTLSLLAVLYYSKKIGIVYWLFTIPLVAMGFTTYSKSFFICITAFVVLLVIFVLLPKHPVWAVLAAVATAIFAYAAMNGKINAVEVILGRFGDGDITTGRADLNKIYIEYFLENPSKLFFGQGLNAYAIDGYNNVHNLFIDAIYKLGLVGVSIYSFVVGSCLYTKGKKKKFIAYLPVIFLLVMYMALAGLTSFELIYHIIICGIAAKYTGNEVVK